MEFWDLVLLAILQGVTEFLPVSSSGHLVLVGGWLGGDVVSQAELADVSVALHFGTLLAITAYYARDLKDILLHQQRQVLLVVVGSLPAAAIGVPIKWLGMDEAMQSKPLAGAMLVITGAVLWWGGGRRCAKTVDAGEVGSDGWMSLRTACLVGVAQALAIIPGLSRSGLTIITATAMGVEPRAAARFSFLLAIPAIGGASLLTLVELVTRDPVTAGPSLSISHLALAAVVAAVVGYGALVALVGLLSRRRLNWFAAWCIPLGLAALALAWPAT